MRNQDEEFEEKAGRRGNLLRLFWYISLGMLVLGYVLIFLFWIL
jgi:hypothetical protein